MLLSFNTHTRGNAMFSFIGSEDSWPGHGGCCYWLWVTPWRMCTFFFLGALLVVVGKRGRREICNRAEKKYMWVNTLICKEVVELTSWL